ncbi:hypothetical protein SCP_0606460 [Sparassis crispa]|uniref:F-box domain-containing protein n=1 Tax=Sparassis crispa TaxID=139825 RepID=A0A401GR07_9APHY|nr:hypothetical protein SCP_0606460 [Sparassis crispa]GBE84667.1 hypothetical protein SCP_0606460 [Sparassis crispa]
MSLLSLNDDVLAAIILFMPPSEVLPFSRTCRYAYSAAIPQYLSEVTIKSTLQLAGFCAFVLAEPFHRPICIHGLDLALQIFHEQDICASVCALTDILRRAICLDSLSVRNLENLLLFGPSLRNVLAALPALRQISFRGIGEISLAVLSQMASRPRHVILDTFWNEAGYTCEGALDKFAQCLETLEIRRASGFVKLNAEVVWPHVRTLHVAYIDHSTSLSRLAYAFPNVRHFKSMASRPFLPDHGPHWAFLDYVEADIPVELFSSIRRLVLRCPYSRESSEINRLTLDMLRRASPVVLACQVHRDIVPHIADVLPALKYLKILVREDLAKSSIESRSLSIAHAVQKLPLVALSLCHGDRWPTALHCDISRLQCIAREVAAVLPTLKDVGFDGPLLLPRHDVCRWFRVTDRNGDTPQLRLLSRQEGDGLEAQLATMGPA